MAGDSPGEFCRRHGLIHHVRLRDPSHLSVDAMRWLDENIIEDYALYPVNNATTSEREALFLACSNELDAFQIKMRLG